VSRIEKKILNEIKKALWQPKHWHL
jgi:hypothetical protein